MARIKKRTPVNFSTPSLFDTADLFDTPSLEPSMPGFERHIKVAKAEYDKRQAIQEQGVQSMAPVTPVDKVLFMSFGSGSSGNCTYVGTTDAGFLIDAGIDNTKVEKELKRNGIPMTAVKGILLTHDHGDHIRYAYSLLRSNRNILLYCTPRVLNGILRRHNVSRRIKDYHKAIYKETPFELAGFRVTAFEVDHDGSDNAGFYISREGFDFTVATDLGQIGPRADYYMRRASYLMIESNYDLDMLQRGQYPEYLKARIMAPNGHLDNKVTATYLASIYRPELKFVFLCHLSQDNNTPGKAMEAVSDALASIGIKVGDGSNSPESLASPIQVMALPRFDSTGLITLRLEGK